MKKNRFVVLSLLSLGIATASFAQEKCEQKCESQCEKGGKGKGQGNGHGSDDFKSLGLTKEQTKKVHAIHQTHQAEVEKIKANAASTPEQKKTSLDALRTKKEADIQAVLTPEQYKKLLALREANKAAYMSEKKEDLKTKLGLTDDQASKIEAIHTKYTPQFDTLKADTTKSEEEKKTAFKALKDAKHLDIKAVLTPDQQKKWD